MPRRRLAARLRTPTFMCLPSPIEELTDSPVRFAESICVTTGGFQRFALRGLAGALHPRFLLACQGLRIVEAELAIEALDQDGGRRVPVAPGDPVIAKGATPRLGKRDADGLVPEAGYRYVLVLSVARLREEHPVGGEVRPGAARILEEVGPRFDHERALGLAGIIPAQPSDPATFPSVARGIGADRALVIEPHLRTVVELGEARRHVLLAQDQGAEFVFRNGGLAVTASQENGHQRPYGNALPGSARG